MTRNKTLGNKVQPLRNVVALNNLVQSLKSRHEDLPGLGVFFGPPGLGKTFGCIFAQVQHDAILVTVQELWTKRDLLEAVLNELSIAPAKRLADMGKQANQGLAIAHRPLIIDEADYALQRGLLSVVRDMHDGSGTPIVLIGMEKFPQKLQTLELIEQRVFAWVQAMQCNERDARLLVQKYANGIEIDDTMLDHIMTINNRNARRMSKDIVYLVEICRQEGVTKVTRDSWGNRPLFHTKAPAPRTGVA